MTESLVQKLSDFVKIESEINPELGKFPSNEAKRYIENVGKNFGFEIIDFKGGNYEKNEVFGSLMIKRGRGEGPRILLLGHMDVVPVSEAEKPLWKSPPYKPEIREGVLYGRGTGDMKAGVIVFLEAFKSMELTRGDVVIAISGDEEIGGFQSVPQMIEKLKELELMPDYVLNAEPSTGKPVVVTQRRGMTQLTYKFPLKKTAIRGKKLVREFISKEGAGSESLHSMTFLLGSDVHGMISGGKHTMDMKISNVESSSRKNNAVPKYVEITTIEEGDEELYYYKSLSGIMNALASIGSLNFPVNKSKYGPSICPNLIDIDEQAGFGVLTFDIRSNLKDENSHEIFRSLIAEHFKYYGVETESKIVSLINSVNVDPQSYFPQLVKDIAERNNFPILTVGEKLGGASDTRFFTNLGIPGIELGPKGKNGHGPNEGVDIQSMITLTKIIQEIYMELK